MDMMDSLMGLEDCRIRFTTGEGDYEGTISRIAPEIQLLIIKKLIWLPKNCKMGTLTFRAHEISDFEVIGRSETPKPDPTHSSNNAQRYYRDTQIHTLFDEEYDETLSVNESELYDEMYRDDEKEYHLKLPPLLSDSLPIDSVVIDSPNQDFHDAIQHMKRQDTVGVSLESPKIGRHEKLHWLCISTESCSFLFDVQALGEEGFSNGLKYILEDSRIEKVIHDCREASDCLYHQYATKLVNVFDTQVADFIINQQRRKKGKFSNRVNSLNSCLAHYLDVPDEFLYHRKRRSYQDDLVFFGLRPVTDDFRDLFIKNVIYLRRLRQELDILLMEPLSGCVDIYLQTLQNKTDKELQLDTFRPDAVPDELLTEQIQIFRFNEHVDIPTVVSSGPPYREIRNTFKAFFDYYDDHEIGKGDMAYNESKPDKEQRWMPIKNFPSHPNEFICRKKECKGDCVAFVEGRFYFCKNPKQEKDSSLPFEKISDSDSSSSTRDLDSGKSNDCENLKDKQEQSAKSMSYSDGEDPWTKLRKAYAETGPTNDNKRKLVFVPAGMELR